jgi:hypothetical protein
MRILKTKESGLMIDIFDVLKDRKDRRIQVQGSVSERYLIQYTIGDLNALVEMIIDNSEYIDTIKFNIEENNDSFTFDLPPIRGARVVGTVGEFFNERVHTDSYKSITFDIDIYTTADIYNKIYSEFEDFIDYFTPGNIIYELGITSDEASIRRNDRFIDNQEDYSVHVNMADILSEDWMDRERPVYAATFSEALDSFDYDTIRGRFTGSELGNSVRLPGDHDADGDAITLEDYLRGEGALD